jgi:hypothetical protein
LERWQASPIVIDRELLINKNVHIGIANFEHLAEAGTQGIKFLLLGILKLQIPLDRT